VGQEGSRGSIYSTSTIPNSGDVTQCCSVTIHEHFSSRKRGQVGSSRRPRYDPVRSRRPSQHNSRGTDRARQWTGHRKPPENRHRRRKKHRRPLPAVDSFSVAARRMRKPFFFPLAPRHPQVDVREVVARAVARSCSLRVRAYIPA
jgi:hypothetical protein